MATIKVRHLVKLSSRAGALPRWFWQPSPGLRRLGFKPQRVPDDFARYTDAADLEYAAMRRAQELNQAADEGRLHSALAPASRPAAPPATRTLGELSAAYRASADFTGLAPATQRGYRQCLDRIEAWGGDVPVRAIDADRVRVLKESMAGTPAFANAVVRVLRLVLEFGRRRGWLQVNPALRPNLTGSAPSGLIWPRPAIGVFVQAADALGLHSIGTAVMLNEWLGQREGDVLRLPRTVLRAGTLWVRQSKTGAGVALPVDEVPHLMTRITQQQDWTLQALTKLRQARLEVAARRRGATAEPPAVVLPATLLVCERTGLPWKPDHFRHAFAEVRAAAAKIQATFEIDHLMPGRDAAHAEAFLIRMLDLTFMQLRHTAVTRLAEAECDANLISTISGHSLATVVQILERYMVRTSKMARLAFGKRAAAEGKGKVPDQPQGQLRLGEE